MRNIKCPLILLGMLLFLPLLISFSSLMWHASHLLAISILFIGFSADLLGGFKILDQIMSSS